MEPGLGFLSQFEQLRDSWFSSLYPAANALFWKCAAVGFVLSMLRWILAHRLDELATAVMLRIVFVFACFAILTHADSWIPALLNSFLEMGEDVAGGQIDPSLVAWQGLTLATVLLQKIGFLGWLTSPVSGTVGLLAAIVVVYAFGRIAIELAVTLVQMYLVTGAGILLLGFMPFSGTAALSERYFGWLLSIGIKVIFLCLLVAAGQELAPAWGEYIEKTNIVDYTVPGLIAVSAWAFLEIVKRTPEFTAALVSGVLGLHGESVIQSAQQTATFGMQGTAAAAIGGRAMQAGGAIMGVAGAAITGAQMVGQALSQRSKPQVPKLHS